MNLGPSKKQPTVIRQTAAAAAVTLSCAAATVTENYGLKLFPCNAKEMGRPNACNSASDLNERCNYAIFAQLIQSRANLIK